MRKKIESKLDREGNYIYVGKYDFGNNVVGVLAEPGTGSASFCCSFANENPSAAHPKVEGLNYIIVGLQHRRWRGVMDVLLHEALELALTELGLRFEPCPNFNKSHAGYSFFMTHEQFSEATARAAGFVSQCQNDLCKIWKANPLKA